jgi:PAS domain S-box-containing protein
LLLDVVAGRLADRCALWHAARENERLAAALRDGAGAAPADVTRQSEVERALRLNEERFRSLVQATTQIVWIRDARGVRAPDSPSWRAYTGQTLEEWTGDGWIEALHPDDRARVRAAWLASTAAQTPYEAEYRLRRADGSWRWTVARGHPIMGGDGKVREWVGTNTDIHDRRLADSVSREWRRRLEAILEAGDIGTWTFDLRRRRLLVDANVALLVGAAPTRARAAPLRLFLRAVHPDDLDAVRAGLARAVEQREPYQLVHRIRRPDGAELTVNVRGRIEFDADGAPVRLSGVALDVTRQVETERRLRSSETARLLGEERYRMVLKGVDVGFCIIEMIYDDAGEPCSYRILEANPAFAQHTGLFDAVGKTIGEILPDFDPRWARIYGRVARIGLPVRVEQHSFGLGRWMDVYASRIGDPAQGQVALFLRDVTEERERNDTLQRLADNLADANRRQSEFLATLAHELRNPLAPVRTGLDLLRIGADTPAMLAKVRPMMERQVNHLVHLVDDLLDLARINSGKIELKKGDVALGDVVMRAVEMTQPAIAARRHAFELQLADEDTRLFADPTRLAQVLGNLLTNAAKYTPEGGRILLAARRDGDRVVVAVTDSGVGIPAEALPRIFDMFTQVGRHPEQEAGGLGIGLHLVRQMTERHGGTVRADSAGPGQGSRFVVEVPVALVTVDPARDGAMPSPAAVEAAAAVAAAVASHTPEGRRLRILLADDNLDAADLLRDVLQLEGHRVEAVGNGPAALEAAGRLAPDVVLLDIGMPGMNGYEVARRLRALPAARLDRRAGERPMLLVALTGWGTAEDRLKSREAGFDAHLTKPVDLDALRALIASRA